MNKGDTLMKILHLGYDHSNDNNDGTYVFANRSYEEQKLNFEKADKRITKLIGYKCTLSTYL